MHDIGATQALLQLVQDAGFGIVAGVVVLAGFIYHQRRQEGRFDRLFDKLIGDKTAAETPASQRNAEVRRNGTTVGLAELGSRMLRVEQRVEEVADTTAATLQRIETSLELLPCKHGGCPAGGGEQ